MEKNYLQQLAECKTEDELFILWKSKPIHRTSYIDKKQAIDLEINHQKVFIADGVVNPEEWEKAPKRVAFILKEAYGETFDWDLKWKLKHNTLWGTIWPSVAEWTYGIHNTTKEHIAVYDPALVSKEANNIWTNQIAVINLKKSSGKSKSSYAEISAYAKADKQEIRRQLEIVDPDIIVCGYTFASLNEVYDGKLIKQQKNWFCFTEEIGGKKRLVIDYYHPANRYPRLLNYYGLVNIYQEALKSEQ